MEGSLTSTRRIVHNLHPVVSSPDLIMPRRPEARSHCSPAVVWLRSVQATVGLRALVPCPSSEKPKLLSVLSLEWIQILLGHLRCMFYKLPWSYTMWLDCEIVAIQRTRLQEKFVAVALVHSGWTRWVLLSRITSDLPVTFNTYQYMLDQFRSIWLGNYAAWIMWGSWVRSEFERFRSFPESPHSVSLLRTGPYTSA